MIELRDYQQRAINDVYTYCRTYEDKHPLLSMATGSGKSIVIAALMKDIVGLPNRRVLQLSHVKELISQNWSQLIKLWPEAPVGIYSASLKKKQLGHQIIIAGIQSVYKKGYLLGFFHVVIIDEVHLLADEESGMYRTLLNTLREINPKIRIIGLSATPWRMKGGLLTESQNPLFDDIIVDIGIKELLDMGYLCPIIRKPSKTQADLSKVKTSNGEFIESSMGEVMDNEVLTNAAIDEMLRYAHDRKSWLIFCAGVPHAEHVRDALLKRNIESACITGNTPIIERDNILRAFKNGEIQALTNNTVLTTGTDIPNIDLVAFLRGTKSPGLFLQCVGRGMRLHPEKSSCLVLDFCGNLERFGPIDTIRAPSPKDPAGGEAPERVCPECQELCHISAKTCPTCGYEFPFDESWKHARKASDAAVLSTEATWIDLDRVVYNRHAGRKELVTQGEETVYVKKPDTLRVTYNAGIQIYREWVCLEHDGYAKERANKWIEKRLICADMERGMSLEDFRRLVNLISIDDIVSDFSLLRTPKRIKVKWQGKYEVITDYEF